MKPPPFAYHAPTTLREALDVLAEVGGDGKVLAGGQSLIPLLNMRLAAPGHVVDVNRVAGLSGVLSGPDGVRVGATARHADVARDAGAYAALPLLRQATKLVAHPVVRNRGTTVGSLVHADPAGEMTAVLALLGGSVELVRASDGGPARRTMAASEFFVGPLESALVAGELAVSASFPVPAGRTGTDMVEVARRHGDYALAGVAAAVTLDDSGRVSRAWAAYLSVAPTPLVLDLTDAVAGGGGGWAAAGRMARAAVDPEPDIHASADYRRHLVDVLTVRALERAAGRARGEESPGG